MGGTTAIQMNSTTGTPHLLLIEDDAAAGATSSIEMNHISNNSDFFEIKSTLHPGVNHYMGWFYNGTPRVVWNEANDGLGVGTISPDEKLEVDGAIKLGNTTNTNNGTIRYTGTDFEGYTSGSWMSLTSGGGGASPWVADANGINYSGR